MDRKLTTIIHRTIVTKLIEDYYNEPDIDKKVQILCKINSLLPRSYCIDIPSLITDDYVDTALYRIERNINGL
jgi:predicted DNA-binding protein (UPF0278 family)